ncbi:MAG: hypothetical protein GX623_00665 [Clostridiales bacterium]|nr:hypothetical protein [Clostridiales bacterium]
MKRKDIWVIAGVVALGLVLLVASRVLRPAPAVPGRPALALSLGAAPDGALPVADSYLRIKQGSEYYQLVPLLGPGEITITQGDWENVIHVDRDGAVMASANCPKQECVHQGRVTLQNRDLRVFQRWITCLPHQVALELLSREEALQLLGEAP